MVSDIYCGVSSGAGCSGTLRYSKMEVLSVTISWCPLILSFFKKFSWFFWQIFNILWDLRMTLVIFEWCLCFTLGGDLQCFFRMLTIYFHVLPYALLLRLAYFLGVLYHFRWTTNYSLVMRCLTGFLNIQLQWHKYKLVSFLTRHHTLPSIFIKDIYHYIF